MRTIGRSLLLGALLVLGGCQTTAPLRDAALPPQPVELEETPFFPQTAYQCGPAALATVLVASGVDVQPGQLAPQVFLPGRKGSLQLELIAAARRHGRVPYILQPDFDALTAELQDGRPVLVLQNLGLSRLPVWHYAVVVGIDPRTNEVILRSGEERRQRMSLRRFLASWQRAGRWALVTVPADELPATAVPLSWLQALAAIEQLGQRELAIRGYVSATQRWPSNPLVWQVLGNARYAAQDRLGARAAYRQAVQFGGDATAWNNLAQTELDLGCVTAARDALARARHGVLPAPVAKAVDETAAAIATAPDGLRCQP